jgi:hypothetical protein
MSFSNRVYSGPLVGMMKDELEALLRDAQQQLMTGAGSLTASTVNSSSFQWAAGLAPMARIKIILSALAQVDPTRPQQSNQIVGRFRAPS